MKRRTRWTGLLLIIVAVAILEAISLVQAYYAQEEKAAKGEKNSISTTEKNAYNTVKSAAEDLSSAVDKLSSAALFQKGSYQKTGSDGMIWEFTSRICCI